MVKFVTKVNNANSKSKTLRTSIPKEIVEELELEHGDSIVWNVEVINNIQKFVIEKKVD